MNPYLTAIQSSWQDMKSYPLYSNERRRLMENEFIDLTEQNEEPDGLSLVFDTSVLDFDSEAFGFDF